MMTGQPSRTRVQIEPAIEFADLSRTVRHLDRRPAPDGPVAAADAVAGLKHRTIVAGFAEFVGGGQAGNAGPEHNHLGPVRGTFLQRDRLGNSADSAQDAHRLHGEVGRLIAADARNLPEKIPTRTPHG